MTLNERRSDTMLVRIGSAKDVPDGQMRVFELAGTTVNVSNASGHLYAFDDTCTHMGCSLAKGELEGTTVTCACHGSQFDVTTGAVLRGSGTAACPIAAVAGRR
jgi:nitrite reductase/ring-hydroxylating ferredoxin subunit